MKKKKKRTNECMLANSHSFLSGPVLLPNRSLGMAETITVLSSKAAAAAASGTNDDDIDREFVVTSKELAEFLRFKIERESPSETRNALLVIAVLITTATYQAVLSPPGGLWQDNGDKESRATGQEAGKTILGTHKFDYRFGIFLACNGAGFYGSLFMIEILTEGFPLRWELYFIILALIASYDSAMISIIPQGKYSILFAVLSILLPLVIVYAAQKARKARILRLSCRGLSGVATLFQNKRSSSGP